MEQRTRQKCVYCLERDATTREHIVARCFFHKQPTHNLTVPTCVECNSGKGDGNERNMSMDEEYVRNVLAFHAGSHGNAVADRLVWDKVLPSFQRRPKGLVKSLAETLKPATLQYKGIIIPDQSTITVDGLRIMRVEQKITRGLYYHHTKTPLPKDCDVFASANIPDQEFYEWLALLRSHQAMPVKLGEGEFYFIGMGGIDPRVSVWLMTFYNRVPSLTFTAPKTAGGIRFGDPDKPVATIRIRREVPAP